MILKPVSKATGKTAALLDSLIDAICKTAPHLAGDSSYIGHVAGSANLANAGLNTALQKKFFLYDGSLTAGSYAEGIAWMVLGNVQEIDQKYYDEFMAFTKTYKMGTARPMQAINNRAILSVTAK